MFEESGISESPLSGHLCVHKDNCFRHLLEVGPQERRSGQHKLRLEHGSLRNGLDPEGLHVEEWEETSLVI